MDSGRVFRALIWKITGNAGKGRHWAVISGKIIAYGLMMTGMLIALQPAMLVNGLWLMGISWFLLAIVEDSKRAYFREHLAGHVSVGDVVQKDVPMIAADMSILSWIDENMLLTGHRACLVIKENQTIGLVSLSDVVKCPREQWSTTPVREIMTPLKHLNIAQPANSIL